MGAESCNVEVQLQASVNLHSSSRLASIALTAPHISTPSCRFCSDSKVAGTVSGVLPAPGLVGPTGGIGGWDLAKAVMKAVTIQWQMLVSQM